MQDITLDIATCHSARSKTFKNKKVKWSEILDRLRSPKRTSETLAEFLKANKEDQLAIKDVGGFVGGYLRGGRRKPETTVYRQILTLDIDFATEDFWIDFIMLYGCEAVLHGTHKHSSQSPRYRLIIPLSREVTSAEYEAVARGIAGQIGINLFDRTTFQPYRLMFWPSVPSDAEYFIQEQRGEPLDPDTVLAMYQDWTDSSLWPTAEAEIKEVKDRVSKQSDPLLKNNIVGAFCRTYSIEEAIDTFLKDFYTEGTNGRYTYTQGSAANGVVLYDGRFAFSHHGTDPASGMLCNAFDLVRIHKFGHLDKGNDSTGVKALSYKEMELFASADEEVRATVAGEAVDRSVYDFADAEDSIAETEEEQAEETEEEREWLKSLELDSKGKILSTASNINLVLSCDRHLKGKFAYNEFDGNRYILSSVPWRKLREPEQFKNVDYSGVRNYIETVYGINGSLKVDDSLALEVERRKYHPIRDYLSSLKWDGTARLDTLLVDALGAEDNPYTREAIRKTLCAAVARVYCPGVKFDTMLTLVGAQGRGKSTLVSKLGKSWFSDSFMTVSGKEAFEQLQGAWIIEVAELSGMRKSDVESTKHYISKQQDTYRPAYMRTNETFKRQCIFIGTSNPRGFLKDATGNRRFMPVDINIKEPTVDVFSMSAEYIDQVWAEAYVKYKAGEKLYLSEEAEVIANKERNAHMEQDERTGVIADYLDAKLPDGWADMDIYERRQYIANPCREGTEREYVCIAEIWCECLCKNREDMDRYKTKDINDLLRAMPEWTESKSTKIFKGYGTQRYYYRTK